MCQQTKRSDSDWSYSEVHRQIFNCATKDERRSLYHQYALQYDNDATNMDWRAPTICVDRLWEQLHNYQTTGAKIRILDAGCGTGWCGERLQNMADFSHLAFHLIGMDFNASMLQHAKNRNVYNEVICADFDKVELQGGNVDFLVASGVFWQGDCGPQSMPSVLKFLKDGGYASISIRRKWFLEEQKTYLEWIDKCGCEIIDNTILPYVSDEVEANYFVLRKRISA